VCKTRCMCMRAQKHAHVQATQEPPVTSTLLAAKLNPPFHIINQPPATLFQQQQCPPAAATAAGAGAACGAWQLPHVAWPAPPQLPCAPPACNHKQHSKGRDWRRVHKERLQGGDWASCSSARASSATRRFSSLQPQTNSRCSAKKTGIWGPAHPRRLQPSTVEPCRCMHNIVEIFSCLALLLPAATKSNGKQKPGEI
jgi:hypothetical protein